MPTIVLFCLVIASAKTFGKDQTDTATQSEIIYRVKSQTSYPDSEEVVLDYVIENHSKAIMVVVSHGLDRIKLYGPDGTPVRPYPYRPSGMGSRMYVINCFPPDGRCTGSLNLSALFPFPIPGKYRCVLTRRIYLLNSADMPDTKNLIDNDYYGTPFEVTAKEIEFRVEKPTSPERKSPKVDPSNGLFEPGFEYNPMESKKYPLRGEGHYRPPNQDATKTETLSLAVSPSVPPLAQGAVRNKAPEAKPTVPTPSKEPAFSTPRSIIVVLIVAACGLLWLVLKRCIK